jgi:deoxyadenosine/deoxycytidine kinase
MPIISISGNIGAGKSTLLKRLESMGHTVMFEGINRGAWGGLLKKYYDDPKKYAYLFQTTVLADMAEQWNVLARAKLGDKIVFTERSCLDNMAFTSLIYEDGNMTNDEYATFKRLHALIGTNPDHVVMLCAKTSTCLDRIRFRDRDGEDKITVQYLDKINAHTERVLSDNGVPYSIVRVEGKAPDQIAKSVDMLVRSLRFPHATLSEVLKKSDK